MGFISTHTEAVIVRSEEMRINNEPTTGEDDAKLPADM